MKLEKGENRFRVLSDAVVGYEWWEDTDNGRKPTRVKTFEEAVKSGVEPLKEFWAFAVWNNATQRVEVLEITQKSIMRSLHSLTLDEDWGDPKQYDVVVTRSGEGLETKYSVTPKPAKKLDSSVLEAYESSEIDLESLFEGKYPMPTSDDKKFDAQDVADEVPF